MSRAALAACALAACNYVTSSFETKTPSGDPFPVGVDSTSGAVLVGVHQAVEGDRVAVLDVLSPITIIDPGPGQQASVSHPDLELLGLRAPGGAFDLPRAHFASPQVIALHPCSDPACALIDGKQCAIGTPAALHGFGAILGLDLFGGDALRLHLATDQIFVLADIAGDDTHRTYACDAVLSKPTRGGGTLVIGGSELEFAQWRIAIQTCLAPDPRPQLLQSQRGVDVLMVASTGIGVSLLGESAYARYREVVRSAPPLDQLPVDSACLPSGPISGRRTTIASLALVGNPTATTPRAPCRQVFAHRLLADHDCKLGDDCPCTRNDPSGGTFCGVPAIVELAPPGGIDVLVVSDANDTLQALRTELRPDQPEVDGILGTSAFRALELDVDRQHDRALVRCVDRASCGVRPQLLDPKDRTQIQGCIAGNPGPIAQ